MYAMSVSIASLVDFGIDYYRLSGGNGHYPYLQEVLNDEYIKRIADDGINVSGKFGKWLQYDGVYHHKMFIGNSYQGSIVFESKRPKCLELLLNVGMRGTRIDAQITIETNEPDRFITNIEEFMLYRREEGVGKLQDIERRKTNGKGDTLYLGSRMSDKFVRIYNKSAEIGDYGGGLLRFEVEMKGEIAKSAFLEIEMANDMHICAMAMLKARLEELGINISGDLDGISLSPIEKQFDADDYASMRWLRRSVAPTVDKLLRHGWALKDVTEAVFGEKLDYVVLNGLPSDDNAWLRQRKIRNLEKIGKA